jgi:hypothetical protein
MPESLARASGWLLLVRVTRRVKSLGRIFQIFNEPLVGLWMSSLKRGSSPRLADSYWSKGPAFMVCQDESTKDWLAAMVPTLVAWEGSRLKVVGMDALPTYKTAVAWFPGSVEDTERYLMRLRRLNWGLDTGHWRVYGRKEETKGVRLVLSIDAASITVLGGLGW